MFLYKSFFLNGDLRKFYAIFQSNKLLGPATMKDILV